MLLLYLTVVGVLFQGYDKRYVNHPKDKCEQTYVILRS